MDYLAINFETIPEDMREQLHYAVVDSLDKLFDIKDGGCRSFKKERYALYVDINDGKLNYDRSNTVLQDYIERDMCFHPVNDFEKIIEKLKEFESNKVTVKINDGYVAVCSPDGIKVGCQTIDWKVLDELNKAKEKIFSK